MIDNDLYQFNQREMAAEKRREFWHQAVAWIAFGCAFVAGFVLGWGWAKWPL
jgi:uncharacterized membrane protein (Fun14 family)